MNKCWGVVIGMMLPLVAAADQATDDVMPSREKMWDIIQEQQRQIDELRAQQQMTDTRVEATADAVERGRQATTSAPDSGVRVGGYGSFRAETNDLDAGTDTFTYRRFVLTVDGRPHDRLETYLELELERFTQLELEKVIESEPDRFEAKQAVEGTDGSEISLEQAWARYRITEGFNLEGGALLVPLGRFNINHDDNQWNLTRRSLVDKGAAVLPSKAAWTELGIGFSGTLPLGKGLLDYRIYAMNGVQLDFEQESEVETEVDTAGGTELVHKLEAEFAPSRGSFSQDLNGNKALAGRLAFRPSPGQEIGLSAYWGRYTPDFMRDEQVTAVALDGLHHLGGLEVEYQFVRTDWGDVERVAADFAGRALVKEQAGVPAEVALGSDTLAESRSGYWVEIRYPFWPASLNDSVLGRGFANPQFEPTLRFEQVFFDHQLTGLEFEDSNVTELDVLNDATVNRATAGFSYRPTPEWVVTLAGEYTWTDDLDSLAGLTNYLSAGANEDDAFGLSLGVAFSF